MVGRTTNGKSHLRTSWMAATRNHIRGQLYRVDQGQISGLSLPSALERQVTTGPGHPKIPSAAALQDLNLEDRHPSERQEPYTADLRRILCLVCGVPQVHREHHRQGQLQKRRAAIRTTAEAAFIGVRAISHTVPTSIFEAFQLLREVRPDHLRRVGVPPYEVVLDMKEEEDGGRVEGRKRLRRGEEDDRIGGLAG